MVRKTLIIRSTHTHVTNVDPKRRALEATLSKLNKKLKADRAAKAKPTEPEDEHKG